MLACWRARPVFPQGRSDSRRGLSCRAEEQAVPPTERHSKKKVVVVGSGWAGLVAAHHLCKQFLKVAMNLDGKQIPLALMKLGFEASVIDFDNTDSAWRKYDPITAREILRQFGCSEKLYRDVFDPLIRVGLFAPSEQCSSAAFLGTLYYFVLANQKNFDLVWCRGTVRDTIFLPWMESLKSQGCKFFEGRKVTDLVLNEETGCINGVVCGKESFKADALILGVGISTLQEIVQRSAALCGREEFLQIMKLKSTDLLTVKLWFDKKVNIPYASNVASAPEEARAWTFFDLNAIYDEYRDSSTTVVQADFYCANDLLPLKDEKIVEKVKSWLSNCIKGFENAAVIDQEISRFPNFHPHFFPGSYKHTMRGSTSFPNVYVAGDWIINRHGSWSQEKSYVSGLEAANRAVDYLEEGSFARIAAVDDDEEHIQLLRSFNRSLYDLRAQLPWYNYFMQ